MPPGGDALAGHARQHPGERGRRVAAAAGEGDAAGQLGHGGAVLVGGHGRGGQVVAAGHLASGDFEVDVAVAPGGLGIGAGAGGAVGDRPCPGFDVGPVGGQRGAGVLAAAGDGSFQQGVAGLLQDFGGAAVRLVLAQRLGDQPGGVPGLAGR